MKKILYLFVFALTSSLLLFSCNEGSVGSSISQSNINIAMDSSFSVSGKSVPNEKIPARVINQLLGLIKAKNYGTLTSDYVTEFMPVTDFDDEGMSLETIDSVKLQIAIADGSFVGDSLVPMRVSAYRLNRILPSPIFSNFDPSDYYSKADFLGSASYIPSVISESDGRKDTIYSRGYRDVKITLPLEFGKEIYAEFLNNKSSFTTPDEFAKLLPGMYITTSDGNGRMMNITSTQVALYYRRVITQDDGTDTTYVTNTNFIASSPEAITNSNIKLDIDPEIQKAVAEGSIIIQAPIGYDVEINFPIQDIIDRYINGTKNDLGVLNSIYFEIPAEKITNDLGITPPPYLLLTRASHKDDFFANKEIADNKTSYYATYSETAKAYIFSDMRNYVLDIIENHGGVATDDDARLILTPVALTTETSGSSYYYEGTTTITSITPYVTSPAIAKLDIDNAVIRLTYSKQSKK